MSDDDRAERIQRIREGRRDGDSDADRAEENESDDAGTETTDDVTDGPDSDAVVGTPQNADRGDATTTDQSDATTMTDTRDVTTDTATTDLPDATTEESDVPETDVDDDAGETDERSGEETISVLEFVLGDERYCLEISYVEQIVERGSVTRIPNAPSFVEGVIDLRGDITTVIDPKQTLATDDGDGGERIVVFDSEQMDDEWSVGWAVDGVRRVSTVSLSSVKESPVDEPWINGVIKRDDGDFVIWTEPGELMRVDADER